MAKFINVMIVRNNKFFLLSLFLAKMRSILAKSKRRNWNIRVCWGYFRIGRIYGKLHRKNNENQTPEGKKCGFRIVYGSNRLLPWRHLSRFKQRFCILMSSRKCSIMAPAKWRNYVYALTEICHQRSKWLHPKATMRKAVGDKTANYF